MGKKKEIIVAVSGYFNPIHQGHIRMFNAAKKLGDKLVVILNTDAQVKLKGSVPFLSEKERKFIVENIKSVDEVILSIDKDGTQCRTLSRLRPDIFANGGDRRSEDHIPEANHCKHFNIKMVFGVGGKKVQSSSTLLNKVKLHA